MARRLHRGLMLALATLDLVDDTADLPETIQRAIAVSRADLEPAVEDLSAWLLAAWQNEQARPAPTRV